MSTFGSWCMLVQAVNYLEVTEGITWGVKTIKNYGMQWKPHKKTDGSEWGCGFYWVLSLKRWDNGSQHMLRQRPFNTWKSYTDLHLAESKSCVWRCSSLSLWFFQVITRTRLGQTVENAWKKKRKKQMDENKWLQNTFQGMSCSYLDRERPVLKASKKILGTASDPPQK